MPNTQDDVIIVGQLQDDKLRNAVTDLVNFVKRESDSMAGHFQGSLDKMQEAMKKFAINQKVAVSLMKEAMQQYGLMFEEVWRQTEGKDKEPKKYAPNTIGELEQEIALREKNRKNMELDSEELKRQNRLIEVQKQALADQKGLNTRAALIKKAKDDLKDAFSAPANSLEQAEKKLAKLQSVASRYRSMPGILDNSQWNRLNNQIDRAREKVEKFKMAMPTMKDIKGMSEKSVSDVAKKLQALRNVQVDPKNTTHVRKLGDEYQRLTRLQNELLGKGIQLTKSNNYLAQSFGYIRNRIVYAMTLGAATSFVKNVYDIRSQYELLERSLGVLLGSFERGTQIFNELNTMALKSPFTLMELGTAAKQLTAYNFKAEEVVNTTKRLADLSAALGVPMERLTYNLGQIRAQTVLTSRDARDFANAGLPIVKSLADYFSELEGRVVSTGDVFERMSKKQVTYNDVMAVLNQMTDEGGKFFDFQAKQAETLRVQLANLTLAWNNMLNEVGAANQGLLTAPIEGLKALFANWREISHVITEVVVAMGIYKGTQILINKLIGESATVMKSSILLDKEKKASALEVEGTVRNLTKTELKQIANKKQIVAADYKAILSTRELSKTQALLLAAYNRNNNELLKALVQLKLLKKAEVESITVGKAWSIVLKQIGLSIKSLGTTIMMFAKQAAIMVAIGAIVEAISTYSEIADKIKDINKGIVDSAKESAESISKFLNDYKETYKRVAEVHASLSKQGTTSPYTATKGGQQPQKLSDEESAKAWVAIKEQIQLSSAASDVFIQKLMSIKDMNERINAGFGYLERIHDVNGALETLDEKAIDIAGDWSKWWNLWTLPDGLIDNLKDYTNYLDKMAKKWGSINNLIEANRENVEGAGGDYHDMEAQLSTFENNLRTTTESMYNSFTSVGITGAEDMREAMERSNQQILQDANLSSKEQLQYKMASEKDFIDYKMSLFNEEYNFEKDRGNTERAERVRQEAIAWKEAFGEGQAVSDAFFNWLKNQHASEINKLFGNMSRRELEHLDWSNPKWQKWASDNAESFSKQYGIAFDKLKGLVNDANRWQIFLKLTITTDEKSVYDTLKDADAAANAAWNKIQRLKRRQAELNNIPAKSLTGEQQEEAKNLLKELIQAQNDYNDALAKGGHASKQYKTTAKDASNARKTAEQEISEALKEELAIIKDMQSNYEKLTNAGVDSMTAIDVSTQGYEATLKKVNKTLAKYGVNKFNAKDFVGKDVHKLLETLQKQRDDLVASGKIKTGSLKDLDVEIQKLTVDAKTYDMKKVTDGLNSELGKIKDEYELSIELNANPELGDMFADMFDIDTDSLPHTFGEAYDRAVTIAKSKLDELRKSMNGTFDIDGFDLMKTNIKGDENGLWNGIDIKSEPLKELIKWQDTWRNMFKQNMVETEKMLDDYVKKYGNYSDKIAEIEADRLEKIKKLNEAYYTDAMRNSPEYKRKRQAIDTASAQEKSQAQWDNFTNTRLYVELFENLELASTGALMAMKEKLDEVKGSMNNLKPERLKQITAQYMKLEKELMSRNPFKGAIKHAKDYMKAVGKTGKQAQKDFIKAQRNYDVQEKVVATLKKQYEQKKTQEPTNTKAIEALAKQLGLEEDKLAKLKEILNAADKEAQKYNMMTKLFKEQANEIAALLQAIGQNLQSLAELRDNLQSTFDFEFSDSINGAIDGLARMGKGISGAVSSAQSGDVFGIVNGVVDVFAGIGDGIASLFGDGSARTKRINKEIAKSVEIVRQLNMAYKELDAVVNNAMGAQELQARREQIQNKQRQVEELQRQMQLEQSKRSKDRDDDKIKEYQESIQDLELEIAELKKDVVANLLGSDIKDAAEQFVSAWVDAWRQGGDTMEAINEKFDDMIDNMIAKSVASYLVSKRLQKIFDEVDKMTDENSEGGPEITMNELKQLKNLIGDKSIAEQINDDLANLYGALEIAFGVNSEQEKNLSELQQGIQGINEDTAGAIEAYMNIVAQRVFEQNQYLMDIRDAIVLDGSVAQLDAMKQLKESVDGIDSDSQLGTLSLMLLQLQQSYQVQSSILSLLNRWDNPAGTAIKVEMV